MSVNWNKRYSFRLTNGDREIYDFLEQVPNNKRSEVIRKMLKIAYRTMNEGKNYDEKINKLYTELQIIKDLQQKNHEEMMSKLKSGISVGENKERNEDEISEKTISDSANEMLSAFGIEF